MKVEYTDLALEDIEDITDYIARDSLTVAARVERRLREGIALLAAQPTIMGRAGRVGGTAELLIRPFIVVYRVRGDVIEIIAVIDSRRGNIADIIGHRS